MRTDVYDKITNQIVSELEADPKLS